MDKVKLTALSPLHHAKQAVKQGAAFYASAVDADYLVNAGQAERAAADDFGTAGRMVYQSREQRAEQPREPEPETQSSVDSEDADDEGKPAAKKVAAKKTARAYHRRDLTAE